MQLMKLTDPTKPATDDLLAKLVGPALQGDPSAMTRLIEGIAPAVRRVVRHVLGPLSTDVADVSQEALLAFVLALATYQRTGPITHFACTIALRAALVARKRTQFRRHRLGELWRGEEPLQTAPPLPADAALASRRMEAFRCLLDELPSVQAEALALRVIADRSLDEIAVATHVPSNTVRSRIRLAREAMRARIEADPALLELLQEEP